MAASNWTPEKGDDNDDSRNDDADGHDGDDYVPPNQTVLEEKEMRRKLMDIESSFLPEPSVLEVGETATTGAPGADDTYLVGVDMQQPSQVEEGDSLNRTQSTEAPSGAYTPPAAHSIAKLEPSLLEDRDARRNQAPEATPEDNGAAVNTSSLETISSSPTAAAAARTVSRVISSARSNSPIKNESAQQRHHDDSFMSSADVNYDAEATPRRKSSVRGRKVSPTGVASKGLQDLTGPSSGEGAESQYLGAPTAERRRKRPKFLTSRQSAHRFSTSSAGTDTTSSEATMGVDYELQSGGAAPANEGIRSQSHGKSKADLSRSTSLGSMASGVTGYSDDNFLDRRVFSGVSDVSLHTLDEEETGSQHRPGSSDKAGAIPQTPKARGQDAEIPTDTVIADHVKNIQVPSAFARQFRENNTRGLSPNKRGSSAATPGFGRTGKSMTLKEQSSTIDRLSKENFDLKMRIHFLNEALSKRSEEGIKEMISENVELKSDKLKLQKDNQALRRSIRDLEKQLRDKNVDKEDKDADKEGRKGSDDEGNGFDEEEIVYLRERMETYEEEIERLRTESIARETEKRKLAAMIKSLGEGRAIGSETGAREERDMWKDMLDAETAAREQAEDENRKLRDEMLRMKTEAAPSGKGSRAGVGRMPSFVSRSTVSDRDTDRNLTTSSATLVEVELLRQENAELRREVSAQTSMLTSRNREKERLYQEIEDLKLGQRRADGGRSVAGDSIFERSVSRAQDRAGSQASDGARTSRASDAERENLEVKNGELRDQVSTLKLENRSIRTQLEECMNDLETLDREYQADIEQAEEELQGIQAERDHAYQLLEEREGALQDLKAEAQEEIDAVGDELDQKMDECQRLEVELRNQQENLNALQAEMRSASEGIIRLEEDAQNNLQRYKQVQQELDDSNRELEEMEKSLRESNNKVQRLTVQQESSQNEIAFLREEQDGDKIKIGDLESELKTTQMSLQSEKDKAKELDQRLAEERHQREVVGSKEKQEVQRIVNELNREATAAKDEVRKLKKKLSSQEIEANTWKERLTELENSLREALGDLNGTRSSLLMSITKLQKELESTTLELEGTRTKLDEKEALLRNRDALLESHGLETRKLADLLERERQAHRADKHSFEQSLKSHHQASRTITQNNSRISDLEAARGADRKRFNTIEQQLKDQLSERNSLFLTLWKRLSAMCGPDWAHSNSLINGNLPSQEVIGNILFWPGFSRNLLLAVKAVENLINGFKTRIKAVERDLTKEYQSLEQNLNLRIKKLERMEDAVQNLRNNQIHHQRGLSGSSSPEISKLRGENRLLKAELNLLQQSNSRSRTAAASATPNASPGRWSEQSGGGARHSAKKSASNIAATSLTRYNSSSAIDSAAGGNSRHERNSSSVSRGSSGIPQPSTHYHSTHVASEPSQEKWILRLRELERRLKSERDARLKDRDGARQRLLESGAENEQLRAQLEREKMRSRTGASIPSTDGAGDDRYLTAGPHEPSRERARGEAGDGDSRRRPQSHRRREHSHGRPRSRSRERLRDRRTPEADEYDGEEDDDDDGTGTGTSDGGGGGLYVEVEV